ncbi:MAG: hypothetical protein Q7J79_06680, partial [Gemmatimonadales bacterium]|nr:hypothetical protein [Gemmatimonadales bacterium]
CYDPLNHEKMCRTRAEKIARIAQDYPPLKVSGRTSGELLVVGWGSTYGAIRQAVRGLREAGAAVSHIHIRYLSPFPKNLGDLLHRFDQVLVPEMNRGQLLTMLRATYLLPAEGLNKVNGKPFKVTEIADAVRSRLGS